MNMCKCCSGVFERFWKLLENTYSVSEFLEAYLELSQTTKIEHFLEIVNSFDKAPS